MSQKTLIDIVITSDCERKEHKQLTDNCIASLVASQPYEDAFNIIVVEGYSKFMDNQHTHDHCMLALPREPFHYNRYLIAGSKCGNAEWVALCNNDLLFDKGWFTALNAAFNAHYGAFKSFGPWCPLTHPQTMQGSNSYYIGYRIAHELTGWCIIVRRELWERMDINQKPEFWYCDNAYADELRRLGEPNMLIRSCIVTHLGSQTIKDLPKAELSRLTYNQKKNYK